MNVKFNKEAWSIQSIVTKLGHWVFSDLTILTFGGLLIVALLTPFLKLDSAPIGFTIAGLMSGLIVGFLSYFEGMIENPEIRRYLPWIKAFTSILTLFLLAITFLNAIINRSLILAFIWFLPGITLSLLVIWMTRPLSIKMLNDQAKWWMWILPTLGVLAAFMAIGIFVLFLAAR